MAQTFQDRAVVVTGGTGALGRAVVGMLLEQGAAVHVPLIEKSTRADFTLAHERLHLVPGVTLDDEAQAHAFFSALPPLWASIHIAGGFAMAPLTRTSFADFEAMWRTNVASCFLSCREAVLRMRETKLGGRIVNVAARPALVPTGGMIGYSAAKGAVAAMTLALAEELADEGIWVNAVAPSIIDTPANRAAMPDADHERWPAPEELATTIVHLASPDNRCARGGIVPLYGRA
ncbi:MAG: SDR family NAD(P)-dependent oxidoreductase [Myxococcales bacterium]|nr:SDR family NAD(P)-dependent oxidoreductase [Myxococcales bacterium]